MRHRLLLTLIALGLLIGPALADRKKSPNAPETTPPPAPLDDTILRAGNEVPTRIDVPFPSHLQYQPTPSNFQPLQYSSDSKAFPLPCELAAQEASCKADGRVIKVYQVADLVVPMPVVGADRTEKPKTMEAELIRKITASVEPKSWVKGQGSIDYFPVGMALVVNHVPAVHKAVELFLEGMRKEQDQQVTLAVRVITVSDALFEKAGWSKVFSDNKAEKGIGMTTVSGLAPTDAEMLLTACQADPATTVMQSPRITALNGQPAQVQVENRETFVTGFSTRVDGGKVVFVPKTETLDLGVRLELEPTVSADGKSVRIKVAAALKELAVLPVPVTPVTTLEKPAAGEHRDVLVPHTRFIQQPKMICREVGETVTLQDGGTALLYGGKAVVERTVREMPPMLADVPVLAELFTRERKVTEKNHLLVMVTGTVIRPEVDVVAVKCEECADCVKPESRLAKLMSGYAKACRDGKSDEARRLAIECLAMDPMCFGKK